MSELLLITGKKGHGKTLWTVDEAFKQYDQGKFDHYYSDITGLRHKGFQPVDDWRDCADNSLIILDEVQFKKAFNRAGGKFEMQVIELTTMRKRGVTIWLITQRARLLNADVLALVDRHIHVQRNGEKTSRIYEFGDAEMNITKTKKLFAQDKYIYTHNQEIYPFYQSIKEGAKHYKKSYINKGVVSTAITLALVVIFGGYFIYSGLTKDGMKIGPTQDMELKAEKKNETTNNNPVAAANSSNSSTPSNQVVSDLSVECRKAVNLEKPECVKWFDDLSKNGSSVTSSGQVVQAVSYNPNKPYDFEYQPQVQPTDFPRMSGVVKMANGRLMAIDQQGNYMSDVSQGDCQRWLNGYRPFNYFAQNKSSGESLENQSQRSVGELTQSNLETSSL